MATLAQIVRDLSRDHVSFSMARANAAVRKSIVAASDDALSHVKFYDSVDEAVSHALKRA